MTSSGSSNSAAFAIYTALPLATRDLIYHSGSRRIYASIPGNVGGGNSIAALDPALITLSAPVYVGSDPGKLAISDNGQYLYVGLDGAGAVRRVDLSTQTPDQEFGLGTEVFFGLHNVYDIEVQPGNPSVVAVSYKYHDGSAANAIAIYENGVKRPVELPRLSAGPFIEFSSSPSTLYAFGNPGFQTMTVDNSGVTVTNTTNVSPITGRVKYEGGRVYFTDGHVINPATGTLLGTFTSPQSSADAVLPDPQLDRVFFLTTSGTSVLVHAFNRTTFSYIGSITLSNLLSSTGTLSSFLRWGDDGLAFRNSDNQVFLLRLPKTWFATGPELTVSPTTMVFPTTPTGISSASLTVTVTNNTQAAIGVNNVTTIGDFGVSNGCGSSIAALSSCNLSVNFSPTVSGIGSGVLTLGDTSTSSPHLIGLFGIGNSSTPIPFISAMSQLSALAGSNGFALSIAGGNFSNNAVVRWNGVNQTTTFVNSTLLTIIVPTSSLAGLESAVITVFNPPPDGGTSNAAVFTIYRSVTLSANDLVYDKTRSQIYASVAGNTAVGNSIVSIDPVSASTGTPVFIGSDPKRLALSENDQYLYAGLNGAAAVRRLDLASFTAGTQFPLGMDPSNSGPYYADDIDGQPGNPGVVAVSRSSQLSSSHGTVGIYDEGVLRSNQTTIFVPSNALAFSSSGTLYGSDTCCSAKALQVMAVNSSGVSSAVTLAYEIGGDIRSDSGVIYGAKGAAVDSTTNRLSGSFQLADSPSSVVSDSVLDRVFFLSSSNSSAVIRAYNRTSFLPVGSMTIPGFNGDNLGSLTRWGIDGLAFRTVSSNQVILLRLPATWFNAPQTITATPTSIVFPAQAVGSSSASSTVTFRNNTASAVSISSITTTAEFSQTNNCGSSVASQAICSINVIFTPAAQGIRTGLLTIADSGTGSPRRVGLSGTAGTAVVVPTVTYTYPEGAAVPSAGFTLTVNGTNFVSGAVVRWNGINLPTTFVSNTQLTATVTAGYLIRFEPVAITVFNGTPNNALSNGVVFSLYRHLSLESKDLIYDRFRQKIYASVPTNNSIVAIDPPSAGLAAPLWVGSAPNKLAISDNGQYLYVGLDGAAAVRRVVLNTQTLGPQLSLGNNGGPYLPRDIKVLPGQPAVIAVARGGGVVVFDDSQKRAQEVPNTSGLGNLAISNTGDLYGFGSGTNLPFMTMSVTNSGVIVTNSTQYLFSGSDVRFEAGKLYSVSGSALDANERTLLGRFSKANGVFFASVVPDAAMGRVFFAAGNHNGGATIYAYDLNTYTLVGTLTVPNVSGNSLSSLIRWGDDGLAFRTDANQVFLFRIPKSWFTSGPAITVSPAGIAFPVQSVNTSSSSQPVTVTNNTQNSIVIQGVVATGRFSQTNSCSTLAANSTCTVNVTFSPDTAGATAGSITITDDTSGGPHIVSLSGIGDASNPVPTITSLNPTGAVAGTAGFTLNVNGTNFVPGAIVRWNGAPRATAFVNSSTVTASIPASDIANVQTATITVVNPAPDGGASNGFPFTVYSALSLSTNGIIYDRVSKKVYAATTNSATPANSIVPIDPVTVTAGASVAVGFQPKVLALSDNGEYLYISELFGGSIRRMDVASQTMGLQFSLSPKGVFDMEVLPGQPSSIAVARSNLGSSGTGGFGVYDDGMKRPSESTNLGATTIAFPPSSGALFGVDADTSATFRRVAIDTNGITIVDSFPQLIGGNDIKVEAGLVYSADGSVIDPTTLIFAGKFALGSAAGSVVPDSSTNLVFFAGNGGVQVFHRTSFQYLGTLSAPGLLTNSASVVRWGVDGLAFRTTSSVYFFRIPNDWITPPTNGRRSQVTSQ